MKSFLISLVLVFISTLSFSQQKLLTPKEFLGYELGDRFTWHYRVVDYFKHVGDVMPNIDVHQYGETYEGRPLIYAIVASLDNYKNLEQIRIDNLKRAGIEQGSPGTNKTPIVWLSYNVHGNEANSMEASMWTLYELANTANTKTQEWLKNTIVILDPCVNPDGRDRYANFYNQYGNKPFNANGDAKEHHEPWPGGRSNHYMFDLNRDWAWETQIESKQRLVIYNQWLPHIHVDFHEQGHNNPYYFAPAAEPFHEVITPWQREFQTLIGKNNAKYFDEQGWLYFTKEVFDLYYPSYGDTYPTYNGAIGMTYEQAGGGYAGLSITTETGDPLTLKDRLTHHHTTGLSTIEITSQNATRVVDEFEKYFRENNTSPASSYKTYVIKATNNIDKLEQLTSWLKTHNISFGHTSAKTSRGFDYQTQTTASVNITSDDIIISTYQPKSRFITTIFEPTSKLPDSLTYDITAWNLMYAYDLKAYALNERLQVNRAYAPKKAVYTNLAAKPYAYIFTYNHINDVAFLTKLMQKGVKVRSMEKAFTVNGQFFNPGTLIVTRRNNEHIADFDNMIINTAKELNRIVYTTSTGFVEKGKDFGSGDLNYIKPPRIAVLFGEQTSSLSTGEIWHFFEQQIHYPITQIGTDYFKNVDLSKYDVFVIPEGYYRLFEESVLEKISTWVNNGGRLILIANAINSFADQKAFELKRFASEEDKAFAEKEEKERKEREGFTRYGDTERKQVSEYISGAIYKVAIDNSHPLGFGLNDFYYSLKTNELRFAYLDNGWNVGILKGKTKPVQGFAGNKANKTLENSLVFGVEPKGEGQVVYLVDNPLFRSFWENGKLLFANAVFMVGQ
ncbi:M14 family metallopeptidase [Chryseosolibacter indicus]|uniref:Zinc carboxypeptidase n=1 Tax=Chryseosolibacter indicus TaxID=2782351 RepID=A0ABS5VQP2_9BACT|nr:M14 family metallopeptidase [Chryseosolibacter indicus]MBT1703099.1 zinc carboxypeptidase [Chryseosolibacter indicus]